MLSLPLDHDIERRLTDRARAQGVPVVTLLCAMIEDALDDYDDREMVTHRLTNPLTPLSADQARLALGLDD